VLTVSACSGSSADDTASAITEAAETPAPEPTSANTASTGTAAPPSTVRAGAPRVDPNEAPTTVPPTVLASSGGRTIETPAALGVTSLPDDVSVTPAGLTIVNTVRADLASVKVYDSPAATTPRLEIANPGQSGEPITFTEDARTSTRALVLLPVRPNGSTGWIDLGDVRSTTHRYRIEVNLSEYRITVYKGSEVVLQDKIGVGKETAPTPAGRYYITKLLKAPNPDGLYGPYAYGLSGFSEVLTSAKWNGNEPILGLHGTNRPDLLGTDVSSGCIRMSNDNITKLAKLLPLGVPVAVRA
jgi:lipoprotein-anchoring transpeptidase ErfK/SrfK